MSGLEAGWRGRCAGRADGKGQPELTLVACPSGNVESSFSGFESSGVVTVAGGTANPALRTRAPMEQVQVSATADMPRPNRATQSYPAGSRNITHLLAAETGVKAPQPDRSDKGMNLATSPAVQADYAR